MTLDRIREYCLAQPEASEDMPWEETLVFWVGGKIFALIVLDPGAKARISVKCSPERFSELLEVEGVVPAPYVGRFKWIALTDFSVLPDRELRALIHQSHNLVAAKLPKSRSQSRVHRTMRSKPADCQRQKFSIHRQSG